MIIVGFYGHFHFPAFRVPLSDRAFNTVIGYCFEHFKELVYVDEEEALFLLPIGGDEKSRQACSVIV